MLRILFFSLILASPARLLSQGIFCTVPHTFYEEASEMAFDHHCKKLYDHIESGRLTAYRDSLLQTPLAAQDLQKLLRHTTSMLIKLDSVQHGQAEFWVSSLIDLQPERWESLNWTGETVRIEAGFEIHLFLKRNAILETCKDAPPFLLNLLRERQGSLNDSILRKTLEHEVRSIWSGQHQKVMAGNLKVYRIDSMSLFMDTGTIDSRLNDTSVQYLDSSDGNYYTEYIRRAVPFDPYSEFTGTSYYFNTGYADKSCTLDILFIGPAYSPVFGGVSLSPQSLYWIPCKEGLPFSDPDTIKNLNWLFEQFVRNRMSESFYKED